MDSNQVLSFWRQVDGGRLHTRADLYQSNRVWQMRMICITRVDTGDTSSRKALVEVSCSSLRSTFGEWSVTCHEAQTDTLVQMTTALDLPERWLQTYYSPEVCMWVSGVDGEGHEEWVWVGEFEPLTQQLYGRILQVILLHLQKEKDGGRRAALAAVFRKLQTYLSQTHREFRQKLQGLLGSDRRAQQMYDLP